MRPIINTSKQLMTVAAPRHWPSDTATATAVPQAKWGARPIRRAASPASGPANLLRIAILGQYTLTQANTTQEQCHKALDHGWTELSEKVEGAGRVGMAAPVGAATTTPHLTHQRARTSGAETGRGGRVFCRRLNKV